MHSSLELGMILEEATSSSFGDKTISLFLSVYANCVHVVTACIVTRSAHALGSRASGLK